MIKRFLSKYDIHTREIIGGTSISLFFKVSGAGLTFLFNIALARYLGAEGTGLYFIAFTAITFGTVVGRMGLDNALLRLTASNAAVKDWIKIKSVHHTGMILALSASLLVTIILLITAPWMGRIVFKKIEIILPLRIMSVAIIPMVLLTLHAEMLKGLKRIKASQFLNGFVVSGLSLLLFLLIGHRFQLNGAVFSYACAAFFSAGLGYLLWKLATPQLQSIRAVFDARELLQSSLPLFWVTSMNMLMSWTSTIVLGMWASASDVAVYNVAARTAMLTSFILVAVNSIAAPKFAMFYKDKDMYNLERTAKNSLKLMLLLATPALALLLILPEAVMSLFGAQFIRGSYILRILAIGQFINVCTGSVGYILMMCGFEGLMRNSITLTALISVGLNLALVPTLGVTGAAIATSISLSFLNLYCTYLVWTRLHVSAIPLNLYNGMKNKN